ncbi:26624_t:CDS:2 [Gigaspora margarita]|uniref:26624_t:CDS:1 n=1 Tax=Gigaspora margarita TaxID=4874 RepID=A0ABN7VLG9_GIGMA|nr:26624_t:CDS:2 [Gigaspora margarita]
MPRYLRSNATLLSSEAIHEIIDARGTKNALSILAKKYKISNNHIYKIWRGQEHPMDPTIEKSSDIMPPHSQIKSHNIHLSTEIQKMVSFYCTACGHTNRMLTEDINQKLIKKNKSNKDYNIQDIINARNSMKRASEAMAIKYKISTRRVYQIWRETHPPIDPRKVMLQSKIGRDNTVNKTDMSIKTRSINHITHSVETPIITSDMQIKRKKLRSKTNRISDPSNIIARGSHIVDSKVNTAEIMTKKEES